MTTATAPTITEIRPRETDEIEVLRAHIQGDVVTPDAEQYDEVRKVHDVSVDRRPAVIVRASGTADVVQTVLFARRRGVPLAVRSGGHSLAAHSMVDGAVVLDLSSMRAVTVNPEQRTARVQPGATTADIMGPAHAYGLALSTGDTSTVGVAGLTTGGGIGWMVRKFGLAIDNLLSAQVVTANGSVLTATAEQNSDLFWAIRGGGGNFGVITEFTFRLAPVGQVLGGALVLPATREVIRGYLDYTVDAPDDLTTIAFLMLAPPAPFIPEDRIGEMVFLVATVWSGEVEEGQRAIAPLRALATPVVDTIEPIPYPAIYMLTEMAAAPHAASLRSMYADELSDAEIDAMLEAMTRVSSPMNMVQFRGLGGALSRMENDATAFGHRDKRYLVLILGLWLDGSEDATPHQAWVESVWQQVRGAADGVYVNFVSDEGTDRVRDAYPPETYARLIETKRRFDPENMFRFNQNIDPR